MTQGLSGKKFIGWGILASLALLVFYFSVLTLANSFSHALEQFSQIWYWILILTAGFGLQVGLYFYIRYQAKEIKARGAKIELAASGGISTGAMIACCAHHLVDVAPILGLTVLFLFLAKYQIFFLLLGISSNIVGIIFMLEIVKKQDLGKECKFLNWFMDFNLKAVKSRVIIILALLLLTSFLIIRNKGGTSDNLSGNLALSSRTDEAGGLSIIIKPIDFSFGKTLQFELSLTTHQGNLGFDLTRQSVLFDNENNQYLPLDWQGGQGGHHLSGTLTFPAIQKTNKIKLVIENVYNVAVREFSWELD